ncbi:ABC transporter permease [Sphingomonas astaxanthinifaciens]|uniref:ABC-2 type transporter transmembrane domain-containing protein n=1 Tax=Sphingomonas astaxanthinifaciens DSM 22298 TaxID=1123267 RepID=A0ABQ5Z9R6_9SPHN|nr:ABC transporter permease [Sphingomonas astaxanthinifaciens]GLR48724.1 hypothetical protein GCM10007925_24440 [Sphingomonas astaxanthinifaciens DSM 22298]
MSDFSRALAAEIDHLVADRWDQLLLFVMPLVLLGLMAAMLLQGVPRDLPVAVVGGRDDQAARDFVQSLEDSPAIRVAARLRSEEEALSLVRRGRIIAFVQLPASLAPRDEPVLRISYNASYLSTGGIAEAGMAQALVEAGRTAAISASGLDGLSALRLAPIPVSLAILANPEASFEWYLQALVDPAVLHLLIACAAAMAMGRALDGRSLAGWVARSGGGAGALAGKLLPYVAICGAWGAAWLIWIAGVRGWQPQGSLALIMAGQLLLLAGTACISAMLVALSKETSTALAASAVYAGSALAYSGGSLPVEGAGLLTRAWSGLLPFTHYLELQMDQWLGAPARVAAPQFLILALYVLVPGLVTLAVLRRSRAA